MIASNHEETTERTFAIIKPDAVQLGYTDAIISRIQNDGFKILEMKRFQMERELAEKFYAVHNQRPFFQELVNFMTSGEVVVLALEKSNAVLDWRKLMGSTNPKNAEPNSLRQLFGTDIGRNAVHGSDSSENAKIELSLFFPNL